jgi:hypothetical protein
MKLFLMSFSVQDVTYKTLRENIKYFCKTTQLKFKFVYFRKNTVLLIRNKLFNKFPRVLRFLLCNLSNFHKNYV